MKLKALALDYDGTIAEDGRLAGEVRTALERARAAGLTVLIVTGRIIGDLRRVAGDLSFADAVVGENGAVITFPRSGRSTALHRRPVPEFLDGLQKRGVEFKAGETIVEADASAAPVALDLIRKLELPLVILFNRGRMMILPQAISKATGLAAALDTFRLSAHNVLAIGDAENDHELPGAEEAEGRLRLIRLAERLTPHVRHRTKYLDVPVTDHHAFVFSKNGRPSGERAHTLKEFVDVLGRTDPECLQGHLERGDFSKWIAGVFGDRPLAGRIRKLEESHRLGHVSDINDSIIEAIRARYEFADR
jgi:phosphoglycolate phosphatase-like HAD superfamily hydrolase